MITPTRCPRALVVFAACTALLLAARGQVTELPETVAPGRVLVEMDGLKLSFDRADAAGNTYSAVGIASTIVSAGITSSTDVQIGIDLFHRETFDIGGRRDSRSGLGDLYFRAKWTFWRDEKHGAALAVIPYVKVPTVRDGFGHDSVEGGFIVPWAMRLPAGLTTGAMFQWDLVRNDADNGYDSKWFVSGYVSQPLVAGFSVYGEAAWEVASSGFSNSAAGSLGAGVLWQWSERLKLDYQVLRGLNSRASEWTHVFRATWGW